MGLLLFCVPSYHHLRLLTSALELPLNSVQLIRSDGVEIQQYDGNESQAFLVRCLRGRIQSVKNRHEVDTVLIMDTQFPVEEVQDDEFLVSSAAEFEAISGIELSAAGRERLATSFYGEVTFNTYQRDVLLGLRIVRALLTVGGGGEPQPGEPVGVHKRIRAESCVACMDSPPSTTLNCGHECVCSGCADEWFREHDKCPVCNAKITSVVKD